MSRKGKYCIASAYDFRFQESFGLKNTQEKQIEAKSTQERWEKQTEAKQMPSQEVKLKLTAPAEEMERIVTKFREMTLNEHPEAALIYLTNSESESYESEDDSNKDEDLLEITDLSDRVPLDKEKINRKLDKDECPHCLCQPCVLCDENVQLWWPKAFTPPHPDNDQYRYALYRRFWTMLYRRGVFCDERYIERKERALDKQRKRQGKFIVSRRDLMPLCVVTQVRNWFPNTDNVNYKNHCWEWE